MKKLFAVAALVLLAGCGLMPKPMDVPVAKSLPEAGQLAQTAVTQANGALAAAYGFIRSGVRDGTINPTQGREWFNTLDGYSEKVDAAQKLISSGGFDQAKAQAQATGALIKILHDQAVAAAARRSEFLPMFVSA